MRPTPQGLVSAEAGRLELLKFSQVKLVDSLTFEADLRLVTDGVDAPRC